MSRNGKLYEVGTPSNAKLVQLDPKQLLGPPPTVSFTYLDKNHGFKGMSKYCRDLKYFSDLDAFFEKVRTYKSVDELVSNHCSHIKTKNTDKESLDKLYKIQKNYNIETGPMIHLHLLRDGKGEFVVHGFHSHGCFHIVELDPKHKKYK